MLSVRNLKKKKKSKFMEYFWEYFFIIIDVTSITEKIILWSDLSLNQVGFLPWLLQLQHFGRCLWVGVFLFLGPRSFSWASHCQRMGRKRDKGRGWRRLRVRGSKRQCCGGGGHHWVVHPHTAPSGHLRGLGPKRNARMQGSKGRQSDLDRCMRF